MLNRFGQRFFDAYLRFFSPLMQWQQQRADHFLAQRNLRWDSQRQNFF